MPYNTKQDAINSAMGGPGWVSTGEQPHLVEVANPLAGRTGEPAKITQQNGIEISVRGPNGEVDQVVIKEVGNNPSTKGGVGFDLVEGPKKNVPQAPTEPSALRRLDAQFKEITDPAQAAVYVQDRKGGAPLKLEPDQVMGNPTTWTTVTHDGTAIGLWDPKTGKMAATIPAAAGGPKPTGKYDTIIDPNDPQKKRVIGMIDTGDKSWHAVSSDPSLPNRQIIQTPNAVYAVDAENKVSKLLDIDKNSPQQAVVVRDSVGGDKLYNFDPNTGKFELAIGGEEHPAIKDQNGLQMVWTEQPDGSFKYAYPPGVKPPTVMTGAGTTSRELIWYDATTGEEVRRAPNTNYTPPTPSIPAANTTAPNILIEDPDNPGKLKWVPNQGQVTIGEATQNLIKSLTGQTVDPAHPMTLDEAKTIIETATAKMTADAQQATTAAGAAQNILSEQQQGAQTGAGLLNQRAATTQGLIQSGLGLLQSTGGRYGNYSGGILNPIPGVGQGLVQGAANFATEMGGGQAVYDTAVRMVQAADPNNQNPDRAAAVGTLTQIMARYKQATGQDYPTVAATKALLQGQQGGGMTAPVTKAAEPTVSPAVVTPTVFQAQFDPRFNAAFPQQPPGTLLPPGIAGLVPQDDPRSLRPRTPQELGAIGGFTAPALV